MSGPAYVASAASAEGSASVTIPSSLAAGDLAVAFSADESSTAPAAPSGWTVERRDGPAGGLYSSVMYKWLVSGDPGSTISFPSSIGVIVVGYSGVPEANASISSVGSVDAAASSDQTNTVTTTYEVGALARGALQQAASSAPISSSNPAPTITSFCSGGSAGGPTAAWAQTLGGSTAGFTATTNADGPWIMQALVVGTPSAPDAPTLSAPGNASYIDVSSGVTLSGVYNSTDGANQNGYAARIKVSGAASYSYYNAATNALQSTLVFNTVSTSPGGTFSAALPAAAVSNGKVYNWSLASQEALASLQGPFASDFTFSAQAGPTIIVDGPTGTIGSAQPDVTYTGTPSSGSQILDYRVVVYSSDQYGASGWTPPAEAQGSTVTTPNTWDSGVVSGNPTSVQVGTPLDNAVSYRAYVNLEETNSVWGDWQYTSFTVSFDPPATPTLTATPDTDPTTGAPRVALAIQGHDNLLSADDASFEGGVGTWGSGFISTAAQTTAESLDGTHSLAVTSTGTGTMSNRTALSDAPVVASAPYVVFARSRANTTGRTCYVESQWFDSSGSTISSLDGPTTSDTSSGWTAAVGAGAAPTNAAAADVQVYWENVVSGEEHFIDEAGLFPGSPGYEQQVLLDGAVALWPLGESSGATQVSDLATETEDATPGAGIAFGQPGPLGTFPGRTTADFPGNASITIPNGLLNAFPLTLEAWIKTPGTGVSDVWQWILSSNPASGNSVWWGTTGGALDYTVSVGHDNHAGDQGLTDNAWHHVVTTIDASGNLTHYVDGAEVGTFAGVVAPATGTSADIGQRGAGVEYWHGNLAEVAIYHSVLTAQQVKAHYDLATVQPAGGAVNTWTRGGLAGTTTAQVQFSDDGGTTWADVRNASVANPLALPSPSQQATVSDYEATPTVTRQYRARVSSGSLTSAWSEVQEATIPGGGGWWELDPTDPSTAVNAQVRDMHPIVTEQSSAHLVLGQQTPNVIASAMGGVDGVVTFETFDSATYIGLTKLLTSQKTIFLSNPYGTDVGVAYVRFGPASGAMTTGMGSKTKHSQLHPSTAAATHHTTRVTWVAQPRPAT